MALLCETLWNSFLIFKIHLLYFFMWLNVFLVLRLRGNSYVLKQLDTELTVEKLGVKMNPSFNISSLLLVFSSLISVSLSVVFFTFVLLGVHWASWICGFVVFVKLGNFSEVFFFFILPHYHFQNPITCVPKLLILVSLFFSIFFLSDSILYSFLLLHFSHSLIVSFVAPNLWLIQSSVFLFLEV